MEEKRGKRVLLVEDQKHWQECVTDALRGLDITLEIVSDYGAGMRALRDGRYDLHIFDNCLGEIRGASIELMQAALSYLEVVPPTIVYSSYLPDHILAQVNALGGVYVQKAGDRSASLRTIVEAILA